MYKSKNKEPEPKTEEKLREVDLVSHHSSRRERLRRRTAAHVHADSRTHIVVARRARRHVARRRIRVRRRERHARGRKQELFNAGGAVRARKNFRGVKERV